MYAKAPRRGRLPSGSACTLLALVALIGAGLTACGHHHHDEGYILVDNRTDLTTNEALFSFRLAPFGEPFTGDLLGGPLPPLAARQLGAWPEDYYDAEGDLELGQLIEWFDVFVGNYDTTVFEVR